MNRCEIDSIIDRIIANPEHIIHWENKERELYRHPHLYQKHIQNYSEDFVFEPHEQIKLYLDFPYGYPDVPSNPDAINLDRSHKHDFFEMFYVLRGTCYCSINQKSYTLQEGSTWIFNTKIQHALLVPSDGSLLLNIIVRKNVFEHSLVHMLPKNDLFMDFFMNSIYGNTMNENYLSFNIEPNSYAESLIFQMIAEYYTKKSYNQHMLLLVFASLLLDLSRTLASHASDEITKKKNLYLPGLIAFISENYKNLTLKEVAEHFHYSETYLSTVITEYLGMPFSEYIRTKKMTHSQQLLVETSHSIDQIATHVGYNDRSAFEKEFKKYYGITPSKFRKDISKKYT